MAKGDKYYHSPFMEESHPLYNRTLELTEDENKDLVARLMGRKEYADSMKVWRNREMTENNAHSNIDTLINQDDNKDFFELLKGILPERETAENFIPPVGLLKLMQLMNQPKETEQAMYRGLTESMFGEPNPVGPQGLPFNQFMQEKQDQKVKSILQQYTNDLIK